MNRTACAHRNSLDDVLVARTSAKIALQAFADVSLAGIGLAPQKVDTTHHHARCAKAALQAMALPEGLLHGVQSAIWPTDAFNGGDRAATDLQRQHIA